MTNVLQELMDAEVVIADLTGGNANVFYELGIAHTVKNAKTVVLITQDKPLFDVAPYHYCPYTMDNVQVFKRRLDEAVKKATPARKKVTRRVGEQYVSEAPVLSRDKIFYGFSVRVLKVGEGGASLQLEVWLDDRPGPHESCDRSLRIWETADVPKIHYAVKLHAVSVEDAEFCICNSNAPKT